MISNKDKVIKYLAGLMTGKEEIDFKEELKNSNELNSIFKKYSNNLSSINEMSKASIDERYFSSLVPKVRAKMAENKKRPLIYRIAPVLPALTLMVFIAINIIYFDLNTPSSFGEIIEDVIADSDSGTIADIADGYTSYFFEDYSLNLDLDDSYFDESQISTSELAEQINPSLIENYTLYDNLSEEDIDKIYNSLINKKIL